MTSNKKPRKNQKYVYRKKKGKMQPYFPKRNRSDPIKIWWWKLVPMSKEGIKRFPKHLQPSIKKTVFEKGIRVDVTPDQIANKKKIEELAVEILREEGTFYLMMFSHKKNKFHCSPVKACSITIRDSSEGLKAKFMQNFKLFRYWFWEGDKKKVK